MKFSDPLAKAYCALDILNEIAVEYGASSKDLCQTVAKRIGGRAAYRRISRLCRLARGTNFANPGHYGVRRDAVDPLANPIRRRQCFLGFSEIGRF